MSDNRTHPVRSRASRATAALLLGTMLVGCTTGARNHGVSKYEPTYLRLTEEQAFAQSLRRNYLELATNAYDRGALDRSDYYSLRALMAAEGKLAQPADPVRYSLDGANASEAAAAGERLNMLMMTGVRTGAPDISARAQAAYDCWLVESSPQGDPTIAQSCRYNALQALAQLDSASTGEQIVVAGGPAVPAPQTYVIESGMPTQTINAHGVTIQVETTHGGDVPQHYVEERIPATYTTVPHSAPMMVETVPVESYAVETMPVQTYAVEAAPIAYAAPMAVEPVMVDHYASAAPMMEPVGAPMNIIPTVDLGPIEGMSIPMVETAPIPVFDTAPVATMPMVEMTALPMTHGGDASGALLDAQAGMKSDFAVYFGFDSDDVTLEAEDVLIDTVEQIKLSGATRVALMGFTDSVGDARYNQLLAMRRAQAVRQYLQSQLGNSVSFAILPVGEVEAVRNGGDGVKEALNRKVEVSIQ